MNLLKNKIKQIQTVVIALLMCLVSVNSAAQTGKQSVNFIKYKNYLIPIYKLGKPGDVNVVTNSQSVGGNIYQITWSSVNGAAYYQINITDENGDVTSVTTTDLEYSLSNLPLGKSSVELVACNAEDECGAAAQVGTYTVNERVRYAVADILGSPILEADQAGNVVAEFHYKPFGETQEEQREDIGYTGHLEDKDLGLTYMQARYYDPVVGRFMANDPVGFSEHFGGAQGPQGFNRYAYVNNNPYKYVDPNGEFLFGAVAGAVLEIGAQLISSGGDFRQLATAGSLGKIAAASAAGAVGVGLGRGIARVAAATTSKLGTVGGATRIAANVGLNTAGNAIAGGLVSVAQNGVNNKIDGQSFFENAGDAAKTGAAFGAAGVLGETGLNAMAKGSQNLSNAANAITVNNRGLATLPETSSGAATGTGLTLSNGAGAVDAAKCNRTKDC